MTQEPLDQGRATFNVPVGAGNYANERITLGAVGPGTRSVSFSEITALAEAPFLAGATVELWLRKVADGTEAAGSMTDEDYTLAGTNFTGLTAAGAQRWAVSAWPGAQIRVKSGGAMGVMSVSASGY
jgi:hypothetical protein